MKKCVAEFIGTSVNPARSFQTVLFHGGKELVQVLVFVIAPTIGSCLAGIFYNLVLKEKLFLFPISCFCIV